MVSLSPKKPVTSGVSQESVLGRTLFLIYINDLPDVLTSECSSLYADDTLVYQEVTTAEQQAEFQRSTSGSNSGKCLSMKERASCCLEKLALRQPSTISSALSGPFQPGSENL